MFKPKNEVALWRVVYDYIKELNVGDIVTYDKLEEVAGEGIGVIRSSIYRTCKELLKTHKRTLQVERMVGYKIIEGMNIMGKAIVRQDRAERQIKSADYEISNVDTIKLTVEERKKLQDFMAYNANIRAAFSNTIEKIEKANQVSQIAQSFTEEQIAKLKTLINI
jgi:hypothetical protein